MRIDFRRAAVLVGAGLTAILALVLMVGRADWPERPQDGMDHVPPKLLSDSDLEREAVSARAEADTTPLVPLPEDSYRIDAAEEPQGGFPPPEEGREMVRFLVRNGHPGAATVRLREQRDWSDALRIWDAGMKTYRDADMRWLRLGSDLARQRKLQGSFQRYDTTNGPPSTSDPNWSSKWPWLRPGPDVYRYAESRGGVIAVVLIAPGEELALDAVREERTAARVQMMRDLEQLLASRRTNEGGR